MDRKMSRGTQLLMLVLGVMFFMFVCLPGISSVQNPSPRSLAPEETQQHSQSEIKGLTAPITSGTEFWIVSIWGPAEETYATMQTVNGSQQFLTKCQEPEWRRPEAGLDKMHYYLSSTDSTLLTPPQGVTGFQNFRILEEVTPSVTPTPSLQPVPTTAGASPIPNATTFAVIPGTPSESPSLIPAKLPVSYFCRGVVIMLIGIGIVVLVTLIRRRFGRG